MRFEGAYTALVTPFAADGSVDYGQLRELVEEQVAGGVAGVVPVGTSGESPTLTHKEHVDVIRAVVEAVAGRVQVIAGAGSNSTAEALQLTRGAIEAGADATLQVAPYYNRPTQAMLVKHFSVLADLGKPVVLYNIPGRTGVEIGVDTVKELSRHPMIQCVKEAGGSVDRVSRTLQVCDIAVLSGDDSLTLPMMAVGARGVVSVVTNVAPRPVVEMVRAALEGRFGDALELHRKWYPLMTGLFLETNPVPVKAALELAGKGEARYRAPLDRMSAGNLEKLRAIMAGLGLVR